MKRISFSPLQILLVLAVSLSMMSFQTGQTDDNPIVRITQVDTSLFPEVTVYVTVVDQNGEPVGIDPSWLVIEENGQQIPLDQIAGVGEAGRLTTMLVMDVSGSMYADGKLEAAKAAALEFVEQMRPGDQIGLLTFNETITYVQPFTENQAEIRTAIEKLKYPDGDTAMYDALVESIALLDPVTGRKGIIALTDGIDNRSKTLPQDVISQIGPSGLSISTIGLGNPEHGLGSVTALDEAALIYLAENAGGAYGYANDEESLSALYQKYAVAMQSEYVLTYTSPSRLRDGVNRALSIRLANSSGTLAGGGEAVFFNPGGLLPEVSAPAPWTIFITLLGGLVVLLLLPGVWGGLSSLARGNRTKGGFVKRSKSKRPSIKLK